MAVRKNKRADQAKAHGALLRVLKAIAAAQAGCEEASRFYGFGPYDLAGNLGREAVTRMAGELIPRLAQASHAPTPERRAAAWADYEAATVSVMVTLEQAAAHLATARRLKAQAR